MPIKPIKLNKPHKLYYGLYLLHFFFVFVLAGPLTLLWTANATLDRFAILDRYRSSGY